MVTVGLESGQIMTGAGVEVVRDAAPQCWGEYSGPACECCEDVSCYQRRGVQELVTMVLL